MTTDDTSHILGSCGCAVKFTEDLETARTERDMALLCHENLKRDHDKLMGHYASLKAAYSEVQSELERAVGELKQLREIHTMGHDSAKWSES